MNEALVQLLKYIAVFYLGAFIGMGFSMALVKKKEGDELIKKENENK